MSVIIGTSILDFFGFLDRARRLVYIASSLALDCIAFVFSLALSIEVSFSLICELLDWSAVLIFTLSSNRPLLLSIDLSSPSGMISFSIAIFSRFLSSFSISNASSGIGNDDFFVATSFPFDGRFADITECVFEYGFSLRSDLLLIDELLFPGFGSNLESSHRSGFFKNFVLSSHS